MFRLLNSGLPRDPYFPANLETLGYFIDSEDEIRSTANSTAYFNYFLTNNDRINDAQREGFNGAVREIVIDRLHNLGLTTIKLPMNRDDERNIPVLVSNDIENKNRVVVLFYEHTQDLGIFAHRVIGGRGGIDQGSAVNFVKYIQAQDTDVGIILANLGQLRWWRRGKKAVSHATWQALPRKYAVLAPPRFDKELNTVPGNRTVGEHAGSIFNEIVKHLCNPDAKLDIIGVSDGATTAFEFLNNNWDTWGSRINAVALIASSHRQDEITNPEFGAWLRKRGRAYVVSDRDRDVAIAGPEGIGYHQAFGCPTYSLGEPHYTELLLTKGYRIIIDWFQEVSANPEYENEEVEISESDGSETLDGAEPFMPAPEGMEAGYQGDRGILMDAWLPIDQPQETAVDATAPDSAIQITNWGD